MLIPTSIFMFAAIKKCTNDRNLQLHLRVHLYL